jgi:hypothetical protein
MPEHRTPNTGTPAFSEKEPAMSLVVRAFPTRSSAAELNEFVSALRGEFSADADTFYRRYGILQETWHLQETENGPWVIVVTIVENPADASQEYARTSEAFDTWFKTQVMAITGIDPSVAPLGPPTSAIFSWSDAARIPGDLDAAFLAVLE